MDLSAAIEQPRLHNQVVPPITTVEVGPKGEDEALSEDLRRRGHEIGVFDINMGVSESGSRDYSLHEQELIDSDYQSRGYC